MMTNISPAKEFDERTLLITGGTGSFGHAVLSRFLSSPLREIRILSRDEKKQEDMRLAFADPKLRFYIGDVRDRHAVRKAMEGVDFVFHAAALKQVPSCEFYPMEAVQTNILGAENVIDAAVDARVRRVIVLSTDKAVYPINAMGLTKALMEKVAFARARLLDPDRTIICATRYGNVMASRGSVIPLFADQIRSRKPLTVTDPKMTRFLMSLEESVELVLHTFLHGRQGDLYVQKSPACTIGDLAEAMMDVLGTKGDIRVIGTRHGEKLYETLVSREEMAKAESLQGYFRIPVDNRDLNYGKYFVEGESTLSDIADYTSHNTRQLNVREVRETLIKLSFIQELLRA